MKKHLLMAAVLLGLAGSALAQGYAVGVSVHGRGFGGSIAIAAPTAPYGYSAGYAGGYYGAAPVARGYRPYPPANSRYVPPGVIDCYCAPDQNGRMVPVRPAYYAY